MKIDIDELTEAELIDLNHRIVEHEQKGKARAEYAEETLKQLSLKLTTEFGRGYSVDNLQNMRQFYLVYGKRNGISAVHFSLGKKQGILTSKADAANGPLDKPQTLSGLSESAPSEAGEKYEKASRISAISFRLSWSHYVFLMRIEDEGEQNFYEIETINQGWSLPELRRQFNSSLYERLALSRDKKKVRDLDNNVKLHSRRDWRSSYCLKVEKSRMFQAAIALRMTR